MGEEELGKPQEHLAFCGKRFQGSGQGLVRVESENVLYSVGIDDSNGEISLQVGLQKHGVTINFKLAKGCGSEICG